MPVVHAQVRDKAPVMSAQDLLRAIEQGQAKKATDLSNTYNDQLNTFTRSIEPDLWGLADRASQGDPAASEALRQAKAQYYAMLQSRDAATGYRSDQTSLVNETEAYFAKFAIGGQGRRQGGQGQAQPVKEKNPASEEKTNTGGGEATVAAEAPVTEPAVPPVPPAQPADTGMWGAGVGLLKDLPPSVGEAIKYPNKADVVSGAAPTETPGVTYPSVDKLKAAFFASLGDKSTAFKNAEWTRWMRANGISSSVTGFTGFDPKKQYKFATGGEVQGPTQAIIGEGGETEYVVPQSKMVEWAKAVLANPENPPNPRDMEGKHMMPDGQMMYDKDMPMMAAGGMVSGEDDPNALPSYMSATQPTPPASATPSSPESSLSSPPVSAPPVDPGALVVKSSGKLNPARVTAKNWEVAKKLTESAVSGGPIRRQLESSGIKDPKVLERATMADYSRGSKELEKGMSVLNNDREFKKWRVEVSKDFHDWYKSASPSELALFGTMKGAAEARNAELDRVQRGEQFREEMDLKWKYYKLQTEAAQGDEVAQRLKLMADYAMSYMQLNEKVIEKDGWAKAREKDPVLNRMVNIWEDFTGTKFSVVVPSGLFRAARIEEARAGDEALMGTRTNSTATPSSAWQSYVSDVESGR